MKISGINNGHSLRRNDRLVIGLIVIIGLAARWFFTAFTVDDAFITLRYAENLIRGNGLVFNAGERVYGTTTPLFTIILALFSLVTRHALTFGKLITVLSDVTVAVVLVFMARRMSGRDWVGYLTGCLYALNPVTVKWSASGMETGLYTLMICLALWRYGQERYRSSYVFAGLAVLTRIDGIFVFGALLLADLLRRRRAAVVDALSGGLPVILWAIFATLYFGSPIPHSAMAKKLTYGGTSSIVVLGQVLDKLAFRAGMLTVIGLVPVVMGMVWGVARHSWGKVILVWWFFYWAFFILTGSHLHGWYLAPPIWVYALSLGLGLGLLVRWLSRWFEGAARRPAVRWIALLILICCVAGATAWLLFARYNEVKWSIGEREEQITKPVGLWLKAQSEPGDTVCLESIGAVGYYSGLYVLDQVGLVSPQVLRFNREMESGPNFGGIVQHFRPKFYVWWETWEQEWWNERPEQKIWLETHYEKKAVFSLSGKSGWAIWERK